MGFLGLLGGLGFLGFLSFLGLKNASFALYKLNDSMTRPATPVDQIWPSDSIFRGPEPPFFGPILAQSALTRPKTGRKLASFGLEKWALKADLVDGCSRSGHRVVELLVLQNSGF